MILIGTVIFFIFWRIVEALIFKPFLSVYEEREALTSGASESSKHILEEAHLINQRYEAELHAARVAAMGEKFQALTAAKKEASTITSDAENQVQEMIRKARWERENSLATTKGQVMSEAESLARTIAESLKNQLVPQQ